LNKQPFQALRNKRKPLLNGLFTAIKNYAFLLLLNFYKDKTAWLIIFI